MHTADIVLNKWWPKGRSTDPQLFFSLVRSEILWRLPKTVSFFIAGKSWKDVSPCDNVAIKNSTKDSPLLLLCRRNEETQSSICDVTPMNLSTCPALFILKEDTKANKFNDVYWSFFHHWIQELLVHVLKKSIFNGKAPVTQIGWHGA